LTIAIGVVLTDQVLKRLAESKGVIPGTDCRRSGLTVVVGHSCGDPKGSWVTFDNP
jgi:hypothetical protein